MKNLLIGLALLVAIHSQGDNSIWGEWRAWGAACRPDTVQVLYGGSSVSVVFNHLQLEMPQGRFLPDRLQAIKACNFRIDVTPPEGMYLTSIHQSYSGGIIKSQGAQARLNIVYGILGILKAKRLDWDENIEISPESPDSIFAVSYYDEVQRTRCREKGQYGFSLTFSGHRRNIRDFLQGGVDSVDTDVGQDPTVEMIPRWAPCPPGSRR